MEKPNAMTYFRGKTHYNCAQAVLKAFAPWYGLDQACLDRFARFGGGNAPEGECGALFAAKAILPTTDAREHVEESFAKVAGSTRCREIRRGRKFSCEQCVQTATDVVFAQLQQSCPLQPPSECAH